ncbi:MAG: S4 domain-containing protein, partial [Bdellovibrionota bacterium]
MPLKKWTVSIAEQDRGKRLDHVLAERLPVLTGEPLSKSKIRTLIVAGAVYLNGKRVRIASK